MKMIEVPFPEINSVEWAHEEHERSGGLHQSTIVHEMAKSLTGKDRGEGFDPQALERYRVMGFIFERAMFDIVFKAAGQEYERPGEVRKNGVIITPDAVRVTDAVMKETKCTYRSMRTADDIAEFQLEFQEWMWQIKNGLNALGLRRAELDVLFINGDYREKRGPHWRRWLMEFNKEELSAHWDMMLRFAKKRRMM